MDYTKLAADTAIKIAGLCPTHRYLLVKQVGFKPSDPWMVLEVATQIALFQACTADEKIWAKVGGDKHKIPDLGCMACVKPDAFGEIVAAARGAASKGDAIDAIGAIKALGESWIYKAAKS